MADIGASATKRFARSRIFRYGLPQNILSERQKGFEGLSEGPMVLTRKRRDKMIYKNFL